MIQRFLLICLSLFLCALSHGQTTRVIVDFPDTGVLDPGQEFTARASVVDADEAVFFYNFQLEYDSETVELIAVNAVSGGFLGAPTVSPALGTPPRNPGPSASRGLLGGSLFQNQTQVDGPLCDMTFRVLPTPARNSFTIQARTFNGPTGLQPVIIYSLTQDDEATVEGSRAYTISGGSTTALVSTEVLSGDPTEPGAMFMMAVKVGSNTTDLAQANIRVRHTPALVSLDAMFLGDWTIDGSDGMSGITLSPMAGESPMIENGWAIYDLKAIDFQGTSSFAQGDIVTLVFTVLAGPGRPYSIQLAETPPEFVLVSQGLQPLEYDFDFSETNLITTAGSPLTAPIVADFVLGKNPNASGAFFEINGTLPVDAADVVAAPEGIVPE